MIQETMINAFAGSPDHRDELPLGYIAWLTVIRRVSMFVDKSRRSSVLQSQNQSFMDGFMKRCNMEREIHKRKLNALVT